VNKIQEEIWNNLTKKSVLDVIKNSDVSVDLENHSNIIEKKYSNTLFNNG
jgi:hypothetical protein